MINTYTFDKETWVDIDHGTPDEIHSIIEQYDIHPYVARELTSTTLKPRIEFHDGYVYCILHFPTFKHTHSTDNANQEVDFIIGKNLLITTRYDTIDALHSFAKTLEVKEILDGHHHSTHHHSLLIGMLRGLYRSVFEELEYIEDLTDDITSRIFKGEEKQMVMSISEITRTLLEFKKVTDLHREVLESLHHHGREMFGETFSTDMELIVLEYLKINITIKSNLETLRELRETNDSLLTAKQNEVMKQLTVMGFVILPLNLIAWIFAMRTEGMPLVTNPNGFWIVIGIMVTASAITMAYARHRKWF